MEIDNHNNNSNKNSSSPNLKTVSIQEYSDIFLNIALNGASENSLESYQIESPSSFINFKDNTTMHSKDLISSQSKNEMEISETSKPSTPANINNNNTNNSNDNNINLKKKIKKLKREIKLKQKILDKTMKKREMIKRHNTPDPNFKDTPSLENRLSKSEPIIFKNKEGSNANNSLIGSPCSISGSVSPANSDLSSLASSPNKNSPMTCSPKYQQHKTSNKNYNTSSPIPIPSVNVVHSSPSNFSHHGHGHTNKKYGHGLLSLPHKIQNYGKKQPHIQNQQEQCDSTYYLPGSAGAAGVNIYSPNFSKHAAAAYNNYCSSYYKQYGTCGSSSNYGNYYNNYPSSPTTTSNASVGQQQQWPNSYQQQHYLNSYQNYYSTPSPQQNK
ncbi:hypothetical protein CYY_002786 [Polysphondylium violaceum]|uniref:Uncharacterized protein n=1 Tax=Polysphondylium violaceum TaxID=133409 RepID=A0A8J4PY87_9MYCE|nr:hypothetical protein CYY_002786 [Polysphondylium violaceum]